MTLKTKSVRRWFLGVLGAVIILPICMSSPTYAEEMIDADETGTESVKMKAAAIQNVDMQNVDMQAAEEGYYTVTYDPNGGAIKYREDGFWCTTEEDLVLDGQAGWLAWYDGIRGNDVLAGWEIMTGTEKGTVIGKEDCINLTEDITVRAVWRNAGWNQIGDDWYFLRWDGTYVTNWADLDGARYYFEEDGRLHIGWLKYDDQWYYCKENGAVAIGWTKINGDWYYFQTTRVAASGRLDVDGKKYLFSEKGRWFGTAGWAKYDGKWYWIQPDGECCTTTRWINGDLYYFSWPTGELQTGWIDEDVYADSDGKVAFGWKQIDGKWYRFGADGKLRGWTYSDGKYYYLNPEGGLLTGTQTIGGQEYHFNSKGELDRSNGVYRITFVTNEKDTYIEAGPEDSGRTEYTFMVPKNNSSGRAVDGVSDDLTLKGWVDTDGNFYTYSELYNIAPTRDMVYTAEWVKVPTITFDPNGGWMTVHFGLGEQEDYKKPFSVRYGKRAYQIQTVDRYGYHFLGWYVAGGARKGTIIQKKDPSLNDYNPDSDTYFKAVWAKPGWNKIEGRWYYMYENGTLCSGLVQIEGKYYWFGYDFAMATGWFKVPDGPWYYAGPDGAIAMGEWIDGYWLNKDGTWTYKKRGSWKHNKKGWWYGDTSGWYAKKKWQKIDGKWYYFDAKGYIVTGTLQIGKKTYQFDKSGVCLNP